jgi:nucleotide-binding universal stress UspA family protein
MARPSSPFQILWALDPFELVSEPHRQAGKIIGTFVRKFGAAVTPASVQSLALDVSANMPARWKERFLTVYEDAIRARVKELKLHSTQPPVVIPCESPVIPERVKALVRYSDKMKPDLIVVTVRKKLGLRELFDDSFAETLFYLSKIPVLIFGPHQRSAQDFSHILFPTDFSDKSRELFRDALRVAQNFHAKVSLFHVIEIGKSNQYPHHALGTSELEDEPDVLRRRALAVAQRWVNESRSLGIRVDLEITETRDEVAHEILKFARRKGVALIAMQDKSSSLSAKVIGSNTRQVVRNAPCPVLILKTGRRASLRKRPLQAA